MWRLVDPHALRSRCLTDAVLERVGEVEAVLVGDSAEKLSSVLGDAEIQLNGLPACWR
jgi:hypothetical protein